MDWKSFIDREKVPISAHIIALLILFFGISTIILTIKMRDNWAVIFGLLILLLIPLHYRQAIYKKEHGQLPASQRIVVGICAIVLSLIFGIISGSTGGLIGAGVLVTYGLFQVLFAIAQRKDAEDQLDI